MANATHLSNGQLICQTGNYFDKIWLFDNMFWQNVSVWQCQNGKICQTRIFFSFCQTANFFLTILPVWRCAVWQILPVWQWHCQKKHSCQNVKIVKRFDKIAVLTVFDTLIKHQTLTNTQFDKEQPFDKFLHFDNYLQFDKTSEDLILSFRPVTFKMNVWKCIWEWLF